MIEYISTRGGAERLTSAQGIIQGLASNSGLLVPENFPKLPVRLEDMVEYSYQDVAKLVMGTFFQDFTKEEIAQCVDRAYDSKFEAEDIAPITKVGDDFVMELYHGRTAAFKDMALSILPYLLTTALKKTGDTSKVAILTATSGDTGKAALEGFANVPRTEIFVYYPKEGVSQVQERQMVCQEGANTHVYGIKGNFDEAQRGVKEIFADKTLREELGKSGVRLSSANSINIGRLVPQVAYYVYAYLKLVERGWISLGEKVNVSVPTGNFGNILAGYYAKNLGVPFGKLICASNKNNVLWEFIKTGRYNAKREFYQTNSPSMDILVSSNLERLLYHLYGSERVGELMADLEQNGEFTITSKEMEKLSDFEASFATEEETLETIEKLYRGKDYLLDTHTAIAWRAGVEEKLDIDQGTNVHEHGNRNKKGVKTLVVSTASPYKFSESLCVALGTNQGKNGFEAMKNLHQATGVKIPQGLENLEERPIRHTDVIEPSGMRYSIIEVLKA